eukprot:3282112-Pyramimonas_sp.AAC.3
MGSRPPYLTYPVCKATRLLQSFEPDICSWCPIQRGYTVRALCRDKEKAASYLGSAKGLEVSR